MKKSNAVADATPKSKFSLSSMKVVAVKSGERVSNDTIPTLETASQLNKFKLNKLASEILGVVGGNRVKLLISGEESINGKYLLAIAADDDSSAAKLAYAAKGASGFSVLQFNYAGVWSKIMQASVDAIEKSGQTLVAEGVAIFREGKGAAAGTYYVNHKTQYELVAVDGIDDENPLVDPETGASYTSVFALVSPEIIDVDLTKEIAPRADKTSTSEGIEVEVEATEE